MYSDKRLPHCAAVAKSREFSLDQHYTCNSKLSLEWICLFSYVSHCFIYFRLRIQLHPAGRKKGKNRKEKDINDTIKNKVEKALIFINGIF